MIVLTLLDSAGRRRSPATMPGYHAGRPPRNKGRHYPADPPTVQEIVVAVMREAGADRHGARLRALIVVLWRGGGLQASADDARKRRATALNRLYPHRQNGQERALRALLPGSQRPRRSVADLPWRGSRPLANGR